MQQLRQWQTPKGLLQHRRPVVLAICCILGLAATLAACGGIDTGSSFTKSDLIGTWKGGSGGVMQFYADGHLKVERLDLTQDLTGTGRFCGFVSGMGTWQFESSGTSPAHRGVFVDLTLGAPVPANCQQLSYVSAPTGGLFSHGGLKICLFEGGDVCSGPGYSRSSRSP